MSTLKELVNETTNIKNELITCYSNLKNNLIEKDIILESDPMPKLSELINKVGEFENFKYAQGAVSNGFFSVYDWGGTETKNLIFSAPLDFAPKTIILYVDYWKVRLYREDTNIVNQTYAYISNKQTTTITLPGYGPIQKSELRINEMTREKVSVTLTGTKTAEAYISKFIALNV